MIPARRKQESVRIGKKIRYKEPGQGRMTDFAVILSCPGFNVRELSVHRKEQQVRRSKPADPT